jgi:hypothetical protein
MAAKPKAAAKSGKAAAAPKGSVKGKSAGTSYTTAQWNAYNKAYSSAAKVTSQRIAMSAAAKGFQKGRLQAYASTVKKYQVATAKARKASVAAYAAEQSLRQARLAKQNTALRNRVSANTTRLTTLLGRAQFAQAGERKYVTRAVLRTVTDAQAMSHERQVFAAASRIAKGAAKPAKPATRKPASARNSAQVRAAATAAGRRAAQSVKAAPKASKTRSAALPEAFSSRGEWITAGNDAGAGTCIAVAVANHRFIATGYRMTDAEVLELHEMAGVKPRIPDVLRAAQELYGIAYARIPAGYGLEFTVAGYPSEYGDHCAVTVPDGKVISWGEVIPLAETLEEAWAIRW